LRAFPAATDDSGHDPHARSHIHHLSGSDSMKAYENFEVYSDPRWNRLGEAAQAEGTEPAGFSYQCLLRAVGGYLDGHGACRINVLEVADGFTVRYQTDRDDPQAVMVHLPNAELELTNRDLERRRKRLTFHFPRGDDASNYEDLMRALGYELDYVKAYSLLIDELDDGYVVTYQFLKPSEGFNVRKRMVILGQDTMRAVLRDAHKRREQRTKGVLTLLAG
jgi:hypothetical protein